MGEGFESFPRINPGASHPLPRFGEKSEPGHLGRIANFELCQIRFLELLYRRNSAMPLE